MAAKTEGRRTACRAPLTADRERPNTYVQIVEFPSYQEANMSQLRPPGDG